MTAEEGRWDYVEGDDPEQHYDKDELEKARQRMEAEKDTLDKEENLFHNSDKSFDYQEGGEQAEDVIKDEHDMLDSGIPEEKAHDILKDKYPADEEEDEGWGVNWGDPEDTAKDIYDLGHPEKADEEEVDYDMSEGERARLDYRSDTELGVEGEDECENCERKEEYLNDDGLCEDCEREQGIDRMESMRDAYEGGVGSGRHKEGGSTLIVARKNVNDDHGYAVWGDADTSVLKEWMNDQKDNPEQADNYKLVKEELQRRGEEGKTEDPEGGISFDPDNYNKIVKDLKSEDLLPDNWGEEGGVGSGRQPEQVGLGNKEQRSDFGAGKFMQQYPMTEEAPDDIDSDIFGKADEDVSISVSGPPAGTQPPANMYDDEQDESPIGEIFSNEHKYKVTDGNHDFKYTDDYEDAKDLADKLGAKVEADESVTSWWGGIGDQEFRSKALAKINADPDLDFNDYWELPNDVQDDLYILYTEGYTDADEAQATERIDDDLARALVSSTDRETIPDMRDTDALLALGLIDAYGHPTPAGSQVIADYRQYQHTDYDMDGAYATRNPSGDYNYITSDTRPDIIDDFSKGTYDFVNDWSEWNESFKEEEHPRGGDSENPGRFSAGSGGDSGGKLSGMSVKDLIKSIKGGSKEWGDWGRDEKTEDAYAEIERRNKEIPTPKRPKGSGGTIFRDDPDAVSKMEAKVKYLEDVADYWKKITKFPHRDYQNHDQLGDAKFYAMSNNSANLRDAKKKLAGIKEQQGRGTQLVRKPTYKSDQYGKSKPRFYYSEEPKEETKSWSDIDDSEISASTKKFANSFAKSKRNTKGDSAKDIMIKNTKYEKLQNIDNQVQKELGFSSGKDFYSRSGMSQYKKAVADKLGGNYDGVDKEINEWLTDDNYHSMNLVVSELKAGIKDNEIEDSWDKSSKEERDSLMDYETDRNANSYDQLDPSHQLSLRARYVDRQTGEEAQKSGYIGCPHCNQEFSNVQWLKDHIDDQHEGKEGYNKDTGHMDCPYCEAKFSPMDDWQMSNYKKHLWSEHQKGESYAKEVSYNYNDIGGEKRKITFTDYNSGKTITGNAVMKGPAGWVVNSGNQARPDLVDETNFISVEGRVNAETWFTDYSDYWKKGDNYVRSGLTISAGIPASWAGTEWDDLPADIQAKIMEAGYVTSYETYDKMSWEFLPRNLKAKLSEGFTPVSESEWNTSTQDKRKEILTENDIESKKKAVEVGSNPNPVIDDSYRQFVEPTEAPTGKVIVDQTYGVSDPETPDGQDLTGITVGEEENKLDFGDKTEEEIERISYGDEGEKEDLEGYHVDSEFSEEYDPVGEPDAMVTDDDKVLDFFKQTGDEEIIEKTPPKIEYLYYKQYPFGRRAGKQNPFGEGYIGRNLGDDEGDRGWYCNHCGTEFESRAGAKIHGDVFVNHLVREYSITDQEQHQAGEVSQHTMDSAHIWWDNKYPERQWSDMRIIERQHAILAFLRDPHTTINESRATEFDSPLRDQHGNPYPTPEGIADCTFCGKVFDNWDVLGDHITIVHNDQGRTREFYGGSAPSSILNHPDWTGYAGEATLDPNRISWSDLSPEEREKRSKENSEFFKKLRESGEWSVISKGIDYDEYGNAYEGGVGSGRKKQWKEKDPKTKDKAHIGWKNYGIDDYIDKAEKEYLKGNEWLNDPQEDIDIPRLRELEDKDRAGLATLEDRNEQVTLTRKYIDWTDPDKSQPYWTSMTQTEAKEFDPSILADPTPWASLAHLAGTTVKDILFPPKAEEENKNHDAEDGRFTSGGGGSKYPEKPEGLTDKEYGKQKKEYEDSQKQRSDRSKNTYAKKKWNSLSPSQRTLFTIRKGLTFDSKKEGDDFTNKNMKGDFDKLPNHFKSSFTDNIDSYRSNEGGLGSGKKDHKSWMRAIEEEQEYNFCDNCSMITEQVNHKCQMCNKRVD